MRILLPGMLLISGSVPGHHWVGDIYDGQRRFIAEVEVREFELINPHPLIFVEITGIPHPERAGAVEVGQTWTLEMDNRRELTALGFDSETFLPGERILVAVDPSHNTQYRENTLYLRALEHRREGFVYVHNVRRLFPAESEGDSLMRHLDKAR